MTLGLARGLRWLTLAVVLGLLAFAIFGPLLNMLLWAVAETWYFPHKLPLEYGFSFWQRVFRPQGNAMVSLTTSIAIALLVAGAMASLDRATIEAARNLGAGRLRVLLEIVVPQVRGTLVVGLILSFVIMMSVLSVPLMINAQSPTMLTVDMAFRINFYGDYGVANALGFISYLMTGVVAWIYLRQGVREGGAR